MLCSKMSMNTSPAKQPANVSMNSSASSGMSYESLRCSWAEDVMRHDESEHNESRKSSSNERDISLEFIDGKNEEKFERLVKEEKLKTPFKRRHSQTPSNESRSNSPNSSNSDSGNPSKSSRPAHQSRGEDSQKRQRNNSYASSTSSSSKGQVETDPAILARRQKQIDYGKNTLAYERYIEMVPRKKRTREHPRTPNKYGKYSRRTFDGLIKVWRKQLHYYDAPEDAKAAAGSDAMGNDDSDSDSD